MTDTKDFICFRCKHWNPFAGGCEAFPDGIPDEILLRNKHGEPLPEQGNDLIFEEISKEEIQSKYGLNLLPEPSSKRWRLSNNNDI